MFLLFNIEIKKIYYLFIEIICFMIVVIVLIGKVFICINGIFRVGMGYVISFVSFCKFFGIFRFLIFLELFFL